MDFNGVKTAWVDFDGTLVDSDGCWIETYRLLCEQQSKPISHETLQSFGGSFETWKNLVLEQLGICDKELLKSAEINFFRRLPNKAVLSIIESLPHCCAVSIITKEPKELVEAWLSYHNIKLFAEISTAGIERENVEFYACRDLMLVDDNYKHCKAAKTAGAYVIGVNSHHTAEQAETMREICDIYIEPSESN